MVFLECYMRGSKEVLFIIDSLRKAKGYRLPLKKALGDGFPGHTGDAYLGLAIYRLSQLNIIELYEDGVLIDAPKSLIKERDNETHDYSLKQVNLALGYRVARRLNKNIYQFEVRLNDHLLEIQELLGFSITGLISKHKYKFSVEITPSFGEPDKALKTEAFVIMPFGTHFDALYEDHITPVCSKLNLNVKRADDINRSSAIISDIWSLLYNSKIVIADCTNKNPNVFYEMGIAHTLGKEIILITQDSEDVPFDVKYLRYLKYDYTPRGMKDFETNLAKFLADK